MTTEELLRKVGRIDLSVRRKRNDRNGWIQVRIGQDYYLKPTLAEALEAARKDQRKKGEWR